MTIDLQIGDNREVLLNYPDNHFDCVVTSPPYWNLRDYETTPLIFDDDPNCKHVWDEEITINRGHPGDKTTLVGPQTADISKSANNFGSFCQKCRAWKGQLGLEPTPELFIKHLVDTFDIIKTRLKDTGNCFVNLGDTYATHTGKRSAQFGTDIEAGNNSIFTKNRPKLDIPEKCLCMVPQRFAWEMIQRGWILRNEIIWKKNNHLPESVQDRLTKTHETVYHFVKQQKYYYNLDAIREPHITIENRPPGIIRSRDWGYKGKYRGNQLIKDFDKPEERIQQKNDETGYGTDGKDMRNHSGNSLNHPLGKNPGDVFELDIDDLSETELKLEIIDLMNQWRILHPNDWNTPSDVWNLNTQPFSMAHFATFPLKLVEKPILAGCPVNGWVLDPFAGSGTVGEFCNDSYRNAVLIELNEEYKPLIVNRANLKQIPLSKIFSYIK